MMQKIFTPKHLPTPPPMPARCASNEQFSAFELVDYPSNEEGNKGEDDEDGEDNLNDSDADVEDNTMPISKPTKSSADLPAKWRKLDIPVQMQKAQKWEEHQKQLQAGLK